MAKSLRSKWRRKCRAVKRVRYGQKELERLKKTLGIDDSATTDDKDVALAEVRDCATVVDVKTIKQVREKSKESGSYEMEVDGKKRIFNLKTMKDQNGSPPVWLHQRKTKKNNVKRKEKNKKTRKQH